jgi:hypothetical protein
MLRDVDFGPSKFIGYDNIDAETYLKTAEESDATRTLKIFATSLKTGRTAVTAWTCISS